MVYDMLEGYRVLSQLYGLLFNCLHMITLRSGSQAIEGCILIISRAHICHLLSLLTRRNHVKPFRIQALYESILGVTFLCSLTDNSSLELKRNIGDEQPLLGLLHIYKDYYPDVIVEKLTPVQVGLFSVRVP